MLPDPVRIERRDAREALMADHAVAAPAPDGHGRAGGAVVGLGHHAARPLRPFFGQMAVNGTPSASAISFWKVREGR